MHLQPDDMQKRRFVQAPTVVFWIVFIILLLLTQTICLHKGYATPSGWTLSDRMSPYSSTMPIDGFYDLPKDSADVVFLGSSILYCDLNPNVIFGRYGYSSYAFGTSMMGTNTMLCFLEEALRTQSPKAIVVEATLMAPYFASAENGGYEVCVWYLPPSAAKLRFIRECDTFDDAASAVLPIYKFHSRWQSLNKLDFQYLFSDRQNYMLGFTGREVVYLPESYDRYTALHVSAEKLVTLQPRIERCIAKAKALCDSYGCELIFATFPSVDAKLPVIYPFFNTLSEYLNEKDIPYYNYNLQDARLQFDKNDITDDRHLTVSGATKLSLTIGEDLQRLLALPDNRSNPAYAYYADCYEKYVALIKTIPGWEALHAF